MGHYSKRQGPKIATTAIIWGFATGMLAICIPLVAITESGPILPLAVILGASGGTLAVWHSAERESAKFSQLKSTVKQLNERVITLEAICSSNELEIQRRFQELEPKDKV
jgi:hypothetical protein